MKGLLIAEKPSLRRTIEAVYNRNKDKIPYEITFMEQRGHLMTLLKPDEMDENMKGWAWEKIPFIPENAGGWQYKVIEEKKTGNFATSKERYYAIKKELNSGSYDFVIHAGDADQEGELLVNIVLKELHNTLPVKRFWTNDMTDEKVLDALINLRDDDNDPMLVNLLAAAYGRQHSDYRFGMNVTIAATLKMGGLAKCGRVKTPILGIVCQRENEIQTFTPKTVYGVKANYAGGFSGQLFDNTQPSDESDEKDEQKGIVWYETMAEATDIIKTLFPPATVVDYEAKRVETYAPKLFKLATAQIAAGKLGYDAVKTLAIIQSLYDKGYMSYPRTDCEYVGSNENFTAMIKSAGSIPSLAPFVNSLDMSIINKVKGTKKWVNDAKLQESGHSALVPTSKAPDFNSLSKEEQDIYTLICRQFIAIFMPPLIQDKTLLIADVNGKQFKSTGKTLVDEGYAKIFGTKFTDAFIPSFNKGDSIDVEEFVLAEKTSTCPKRFTDASLIAACEAPHKYINDEELKKSGEKFKIGTPATRANIIEELISSNKYLERKKDGKTINIVPTDAGMTIYENLKDYDICRVDMTGKWEALLEKVRHGEMTLDELERIMQDSVNKLIEDIKASDMAKFGNVTKEPICKCPVCKEGDIKPSNKSFYCTRFKEGCDFSIYHKVCDTLYKPDEIVKLLNGETVRKKIKKNGSAWEQDLKFNPETKKIEFIKKEVKEEDTAYNCPNCGEMIKDAGNRMICVGNCGFQFWKITCKHEMTSKEINNFFTTNETGLIKGFISKAGNKFDANVVLNATRTGTDFSYPPRD